MEEGDMITRDRLEAVDVEAIWDASSPERSGEDPGRHPTRPAAGGWRRGLLVGWLAVLGTLLVFEPRPTNADAELPLWATALSVAFLGAWCVTLAGLLRHRSWGFTASAVASGVGVAIAAACAATGHHAGMWWAYEALAFGALGGASVLAARAVGR
jgi:hypothetical protein